MLPEDSLHPLQRGETRIPQGRRSPIEAARAQITLVVLISMVAAAASTRQSDRASSVEAPATVMRLDLNSATFEELNLLPGIGDKMAAKLIEQRQHCGGFIDWRSVESIPGMGPATVAEMKRWCSVPPPASNENAILLASRNH